MNELCLISFKDFIESHTQELAQKNVVILCNDFTENDFPEDYINFPKLMMNSLTIVCEGFQASHLSFLCRYIDDINQPKITIESSEKFFPDDSSFTLLANIGKNISLNLKTNDYPGEIARNPYFQQYFTNQNSNHYRPNINVAINQQKIPYLRSSLNLSAENNLYL